MLMDKFYAEISHETLIAAIRSLDAAIHQVSSNVKSDLSKLTAKDKKRFMEFSKAALELKSAYPSAQKKNPELPPYDSLVKRA